MLIYRGAPIATLTDARPTDATAFPWEVTLAPIGALPTVVEERIREVWDIVDEGSFSCLDAAEARVAQLRLVWVTPDGDVRRVRSMAWSPDGVAIVDA